MFSFEIPLLLLITLESIGITYDECEYYGVLAWGYDFFSFSRAFSTTSSYW
jgi:hypothetical protein